MVACCGNDVLFGTASVGDDRVGVQVWGDLRHGIGSLADWHRQEYQIGVMQGGSHVGSYFIDDATLNSALHVLQAASDADDMFNQSGVAQCQRE